jgi:hypothetical protein
VTETEFGLILKFRIRSPSLNSFPNTHYRAALKSCLVNLAKTQTSARTAGFGDHAPRESGELRAGELSVGINRPKTIQDVVGFGSKLQRVSFADAKHP